MAPSIKGSQSCTSSCVLLIRSTAKYPKYPSALLGAARGASELGGLFQETASLSWLNHFLHGGHGRSTSRSCRHSFRRCGFLLLCGLIGSFFFLLSYPSCFRGRARNCFIAGVQFLREDDLDTMIHLLNLRFSGTDLTEMFVAASAPADTVASRIIFVSRPWIPITPLMLCL